MYQELLRMHVGGDDEDNEQEEDYQANVYKTITFNEYVIYCI